MLSFCLTDFRLPKSANMMAAMIGASRYLKKNTNNSFISFDRFVYKLVS